MRARRRGEHVTPLAFDHQPSSAALRDAVENALGRPLTDAEARRLHYEATAVSMDPTIHAETETYGGNNSRSRRTADAADLRAAAESNFDAIEADLLEHHSQAEVEQMRAQMHGRNQQRGVYDLNDPDPHVRTRAALRLIGRTGDR